MNNDLQMREFLFQAKLPLIDERNDILSSWGYILFRLGRKRLKALDLFLDDLDSKERELANSWYFERN